MGEDKVGVDQVDTITLRARALRKDSTNAGENPMEPSPGKAA